MKNRVFPDSDLERVPLERFCMDESVIFAFAGCGAGGTAKVACAPYVYTSTWVGTKQGKSNTYVIEAGKNSCARLVLRFALPDGPQSRHYWATVSPSVDKARQPSQQLEASGSDYNSAGATTIEVERKPFVVTAQVQDAAKGGAAVDEQPLLVNGYAMCDKGLK